MLKRIADISIDLFIGLCVLSRADSLVQASDPAADEAQTLCEMFMAQARRRMLRNVRGMQRNEDAAVERIATSILGRGSYPWDVI